MRAGTANRATSQNKQVLPSLVNDAQQYRNYTANAALPPRAHTRNGEPRKKRGMVFAEEGYPVVSTQSAAMMQNFSTGTNFHHQQNFVAQQNYLTSEPIIPPQSQQQVMPIFPIELSTKPYHTGGKPF